MSCAVLFFYYIFKYINIKDGKQMINAMVHIVNAKCVDGQ